MAIYLCPNSCSPFARGDRYRVYDEVEWFDKVCMNGGKNVGCASRNFAGVRLQRT